MGTHYFARNSAAGIDRTSVSQVVDTTSAGKFDPIFVSSAIGISNGTIDYGQINGPFDDGSTSIGAHYLRLDLWAQFIGASGTLLLWMNGLTPAYRVYSPSGSIFQMQYWNTSTSAWVNWGAATSAVVSQQLVKMVVHIVPQVSFEIRIGDVLMASSTTAASTAPATWDNLRLGNCNTTGTTYFSQIMCADYDISAAQCYAPALNGNSTTDTAGTGDVTDVNETVLNDNTAIILPVVGNRRGFTKAAVTIPSGFAIIGAVLNARCRVAGGTVTAVKLGYRSGASRASSSRSPGVTYTGRGAFVGTDPATGAAWSQAGFNSAEPFIEAA